MKELTRGIASLRPAERAKARAHRLSLAPAPALHPADRAALADAGWVVQSVQRLSGGALHHHWRLRLVQGTEGTRRAQGIKDAEAETLVMRVTASPKLAISLSLCVEAKLLDALADQALPVPRPLALLNLPKAGQALLTRYIPGQAKRRLSVTEGERLAPQLAVLAAKVHRALPPAVLTAYDPLPPLFRALDPRLAALASRLDESGLLHPRQQVLLHGDMRTGNYLVQGGRISGLLDWEFAALGDPLADIAWLSLPPWLYGASNRAGAGLVPMEHFIALYEQASGLRLSRSGRTAWRIAGLLRWGAIARLQDARLGLAPDSIEPLSPLLSLAQSWLDSL